MNVTLRQLRAFVAVAETENFTRAADKLSLSQSTVSTLVRELEENLGLRLFDRHTRMLRLTQAGEEILPLTRKTLNDLDSVIGSSTQLKALGRGRVSIAASSLQAALLIPRFIRSFCLEHPNVQVMLRDVSQKEVLDMVRAGEVDFGLGTMSETQHDLAARVLTTDYFIAVMRADHPLARVKNLTWVDLMNHPLIGPPPSNPLREHLDFMLAREGITFTRRYEVSLPLTMIGMVEGGLGMAIMTTAVTKLALGLGLLVKDITNPTITRDMSLLFHIERSLSPAARNFRDLLISNRFQLSDASGSGIT